MTKLLAALLLLLGALAPLAARAQTSTGAVVVAACNTALATNPQIGAPAFNTQDVKNNLCVTLSGTVTLGTGSANIGVTGVGQGTSTGGEIGPLMQGAVTTAAPGYGNNVTQPLSLDTSGGLRVDCIAGCSSSSNPSFGAAFPATGLAIGAKSGANMVNLSADGSNNLNVNCAVGCAGGTTSNATSGVATSATNGASVTWLYGFNGATWDQLQVDASKFLKVNVAAGAVAATQSGTWTVQPGNTANTTAWKVDGSAVTQPVSGTITANAGTNLNTSALALDTSVNGLLLAQGSATSGQKGPLVLGAVTTAAPAYTTAQSSPLSLTTAGLLRVDGSGVTQPVSGTVTANAGSGTFNIQANASVNVAQMNGVTVTMGNGIAGTGVQRVAIASDNTAFTVNAAESGTWTVQPGNTANTTAWLASNNDGTNTQKVLAATTAPAQADKAAVVALSPSPAPVCTSVIAVNQTAATDLHTATGKTFICSIVLVSASAQNISLTEGTGSVCATGAAALIGGTTASVALAANGGFSAVADRPWLKMQTTNDHLCLQQSGAGNVSGVVTFVDF